MAKRQERFTRRDFLRVVGAAGTAPLLAPGRVLAAQPVIPKRPFGRSGIDVSILSLGGMFDVPGNQLLLRQALDLGISYWDTADCYEGGNSEKGFGKFFKRFPEDRKKVFLVTKADFREPDQMSRLLKRSLERLNTDYIDLFLAHNIDAIQEVDRTATRTWVEKRKSEGKIKLFGFSTHRNVVESLTPAANLGWIDGVMLAYNYRVMNTAATKTAVDACHKAGIGLTAMKFRGYGPVPADTGAGQKLVERFRKKGFTEDQAKLKAVWENPKISSLCALMKNFSTMTSFVDAARGPARLSDGDRKALERHARETHRGFCAGCSRNCEPALNDEVPVADVMRFLMYHHGYGETERAKDLFRDLQPAVRERLPHLDYSDAESRCPHHLPIARLLSEACRILA